VSQFRVALTFDVEHPDRAAAPGATERILEVLATADMVATMFLQGRWAQAYPQTARSIAEAGHLIGNHSHYHARLPMFTLRGLISDVRSATAAICDTTGVDPRPWFRCPFGAVDRGTRVLGGLARLGYRNVGWHVDAHDWAARGPAAMTRRVLAGVVDHGDGAVVLMHGWPTFTPLALPTVIAALRDRGAEFVTIAQLPELPARAPWDRPAPA
jgi:peptidoglycan/xylan/chitin deacetylase (PgdA/CDA1 family)